MKRALIYIVVVASLALAGCGSETSAGPSDPAAIAPANTLVFATLNLAPAGAEGADLDAASRKILGSDARSGIGQAFTRATSTNGTLDYDADVKPWLGDTLSVVVTRAGIHDGDFALLAASTDDDKARAAVAKDLEGKRPQTRSYRDVDYDVIDGNIANGIVDHFVVAGTESAFKAVVDAAKGGRSLAESEHWKDGVANRAQGKSGIAFVDAKALLQSLASGLPGGAPVVAPFLLGLIDLHPFVATLDAQPDRLVVDVSSPGTRPDERGPRAASSPLIESLPARSWLALAVPDVGATLAKFIDSLSANPLLAGAVTRVATQLKAKTGLDLRRDVLDAVGDVGAFAVGTKPASAGGAVIVATTRPEALAAAVPGLKRLAVVRRRDGVAFAHGAAAARALRRPTDKLGDTPLFAKAANAVGQRPTLFVDFARALQLAAAAPHHRSDAEFARALPHLAHIEYVAAGARRSGALDVIRTVIGIR